jgi:hypothetical protein
LTSSLSGKPLNSKKNESKHILPPPIQRAIIQGYMVLQRAGMDDNNQCDGRCLGNLQNNKLFDMKKLTLTQWACILSAILMIALRCASGNTNRPVQLAPDTSEWLTNHSEIPNVDTIAVVVQISILNIKRLRWIIDSQQRLEALNGQAYDKYFHYAIGVQNNYRDSIIDLENMIGHHEFDYLRK